MESIRRVTSSGPDGKWDKVFKSGLSKFFKDCLPQNLLTLLLNALSQI